MADVTLKYVGNGAFFVGIPTTDLPSDSYVPTAEEVAMLVASGLYERVDPAPKPLESPAVKGKQPHREETAP